MAFGILAGVFSGAGAGLVEAAKVRREEAQAELERQFTLQRDELAFQRQSALQEDSQSFQLSLDERRRGYDLEDRAYEEDRANRSSERASNVYESLFGSESGGDFGAANDEGYVGRSQFGQSRLDDYAAAHGTPRISIETFRNNPDLQEDVEKWHFADINSFIDNNELMRFEGQIINGVRVTRSGMIAAAHLGGKGGLQRYLESGGEYNPTDSNGTSLSDYMLKHGNLSTDMSEVWDVLADPNVDESVKDDIRLRLGLDPDPDDDTRTGYSQQFTGLVDADDDGEEDDPVRFGSDPEGNIGPIMGPDGDYIRTGGERSTDEPFELDDNVEEAVEAEFMDPADQAAITEEIDRLIREGKADSQLSAFRMASQAAVYEASGGVDESWLPTGNTPWRGDSTNMPENLEDATMGRIIRFDYGDTAADGEVDGEAVKAASGSATNVATETAMEAPEAETTVAPKTDVTPEAIMQMGPDELLALRSDLDSLTAPQLQALRDRARELTSGQ